MVTQKEYQRKKADFWEGKKIRLVKDIENGRMKIPAETICTVERKFKGFQLTADPCKCCGVRIMITNVPPTDVELIDQEKE